VVIGYGTQERQRLTSAVGSLNGEALENQPASSPEASLQGKIPGVQVIQNSGNPGNGLSVRIRGSASITTSNQPLYVIDGVPMDAEPIEAIGMGGQDLTTLSGLSANDIESIDVLKDAAQPRSMAPAAPTG
jgi:outer membrane receptor protein involved in Fe transport